MSGATVFVLVLVLAGLLAIAVADHRDTRRRDRDRIDPAAAERAAKRAQKEAAEQAHRPTVPRRSRR